jgi:uncharacterized iron-regulated protein
MRDLFKPYIHVALFLVIISACGCTGIRPVRMPTAMVEGLTRHFYPGHIISLPKGEILSFEDLIGNLTKKRLVFVGEVHSSPEDHLLEVQILQALLAESRSDVAMEFFQASQQQAIDLYLNGKTDETTFLKEAHWYREWGFPYRFYRPLILATKGRNRRLFAINAPNRIVRKVARQGLDALTPQERDQIARHIDLTDRQHRAFLKKIYTMHKHGDIGNFEYFYQAQCVWEDTMAEHIADFLKTHRDNLVVFAGNGHIENRYGIPNRVIKRIPVPMAIVVTHAVDEPITFKKNAADFIWLTGRSFPAMPQKNPGKNDKNSL